MRSRIYSGQVMHVRSRPVRHRFVLPYYWYAFDLDELPELDRTLGGFGFNRAAPVSLHESDYLSGPGSLREKVLRLLPDETARAVQRIELVTMARFLGRVFNPVSFHYCLGAEDRVLAIVAEVNNTFGERHPYVLIDQDGRGRVLRYSHAKEFHVSPFNNMAGRYEFRFVRSGDRMRVGVALLRDGERVLDATMTGRGRELTGASLRHVLLWHPFIPLLTMARIVRQAAALKFLRRLPVFTRPPPAHPRTVVVGAPSLRERFCMWAVLRHLGRLREGRLIVRLPDGSERTMGSGEAQEDAARLNVRDYRFFRRLAIAGDIGFGESFTAGEWDSPDLVRLLGLFARNMRTMAGSGPIARGIGRGVSRIQHALNRNTRRGSRRNIEAHYDLGNDFYRTFLDPETMMYSCGIFRAEEDLAAAQRNKLDALIRMARIGPGDHVLEIGCGWGGFAIEAVRRTGCRVTGITLSPSQLELGMERVRAAGLSGSIDFQLCDYRDVQGEFDRIVSIEMLEAVGPHYFGTYFQVLDRRLKPGGRAVIQVITIPDHRYETYRRQTDWIQKHIFPGGVLPSLTALSRAMAGHSELMVDELVNIGPHYERTLRLWRERFCANRDALLRMGYDERFQRMWLYYLAYCEAGFGTRYINNLQMVLVRPGEGGRSSGS